MAFKFKQFAFLTLILSTFFVFSGCEDKECSTKLTTEVEPYQVPVTRDEQIVIPTGNIDESRIGEKTRVSFSLGNTKRGVKFVSQTPNRYELIIKIERETGWEMYDNIINDIENGRIEFYSLSELKSFVADMELLYGYKFEWQVKAYIEDADTGTRRLTARTPKMEITISDNDGYEMNLITVDADVLTPEVTGMNWTSKKATDSETNSEYDVIDLSIDVELPYVEDRTSFKATLYRTVANTDENGTVTKSFEPVYTANNIEPEDVIDNKFSFQVANNLTLKTLYGTDTVEAGVNTQFMFKLEPEEDMNYLAFKESYEVKKNLTGGFEAVRKEVVKDFEADYQNDFFAQKCNAVATAELNDVENLTVKSIEWVSNSGRELTVSEDGLVATFQRVENSRFVDDWNMTIVSEVSGQEIISKYIVNLKSSDYDISECFSNPDN